MSTEDILRVVQATRALSWPDSYMTVICTDGYLYWWDHDGSSGCRELLRSESHLVGLVRVYVWPFGIGDGPDIEYTLSPELLEQRDEESR